MKTTTQQDKQSFMRAATVACGIFLATFSGQIGFAQAKNPEPVPQSVMATTAPGTTASHALSKPAAEEEGLAPANKPGEQGIKVHGHWVIDIKNPDGSLAKHLDFENSLTTQPATGTTANASGDQILGALLSGTGSAGLPSIVMTEFPGGASTLPAGTDPTYLCGQYALAPGYTCGIIETDSNSVSLLPGPTGSTQYGLLSTVNFLSPVSLVLSGKFTVPSSGWTSLSMVQTVLPLCYSNGALETGGTGSNGLKGSSYVGSGTVAPNTCDITQAANTYVTIGPLTQTIVPGAPVTVTAGQVIAVTVTLSFS